MRKQARALYLILIFILSGCLQTENSDSLDAATGITGSPEFLAAQAVFASSCNCHNFYALTEDQLKASGLVVAKQPMSSAIYIRTKGSGSPSADMPPSSSISTTDLTKISDWINSLQ